MFVVVVKGMTTVVRIYVFNEVTQIKCDIHLWSKMTLNCHMIVERYVSSGHNIKGGSNGHFNHPDLTRGQRFLSLWRGIQFRKKWLAV